MRASNMSAPLLSLVPAPGWLARGIDTGDRRDSLRRWAESTGDAQTQAVTELVIRYGLAHGSFPWIRAGVSGSRWPDDTIDFRPLARVAELTPGEDGLVMRIASEFGRGLEVSPSVLADLDDDRRPYVLSVFALRPMGEWPPDRDVAPQIPMEAIVEVIAAERPGLDRPLRDMYSEGDAAADDRD